MNSFEVPGTIFTGTNQSVFQILYGFELNDDQFPQEAKLCSVPDT